VIDDGGLVIGDCSDLGLGSFFTLFIFGIEDHLAAAFEAGFHAVQQR